MHKYIKKIFLFILLVGIVGMCLSLILKNSYMGDAATWFGGCASAIAVLFAYMQFDNADKQLKELKKERDLEYLPELISVSEVKTLYLHPTIETCEKDLEEFKFEIENVGVKAALNITISYYIDDNVEDIKNFISQYSPNEVFNKYDDTPFGEKVEYYNKNWDLRKVTPFDDNVTSENIPFLQKNKTCELTLPFSYLLMVRDYYEEMDYTNDDEFMIERNQFPNLIMELKYEDLQGKQYTKKLEAVINFDGYRRDGNKTYPRVFYNVFN